MTAAPIAGEIRSILTHRYVEEYLAEPNQEFTRRSAIRAENGGLTKRSRITGKAERMTAATTSFSAIERSRRKKDLLAIQQVVDSPVWEVKPDAAWGQT